MAMPLGASLDARLACSAEIKEREDMHEVVVRLGEEDLVELQAVLLDEDEGAALEFLKARIAPRIPAKGTAPCDSSRRNPYLWKSAPTDYAVYRRGKDGEQSST